MSYTVKQLSDRAGISVRTLHYYDEIGLLNPERVGSNGYRHYSQESLMRLQQILFYRELGMSLADIRHIMGRSDFDAVEALTGHRQALEARVERLNHLIRTVDDTILHLKGKKVMSDEKLFEAFSEEKQEEYARRAEHMYDHEIVRASNRRWKSYSQEEKQHILDEGNRIYLDILAVMDKGASSPEVQDCIQRWRRHMDYFWTPNLDQLTALAVGYSSNPEFKANFDKIDPRLAGFMLEAVKVYAGRARD